MTFRLTTLDENKEKLEENQDGQGIRSIIHVLLITVCFPYNLFAFMHKKNAWILSDS